ncbi:MAG: rhodanese-like domain-containing protein [Blastocatellia bacterium]
MEKILTANKRQKRMRHTLQWIGCGWLLLVGLYFSACRQSAASNAPVVVADLTEMKRTIQQRFPGVRQLSTAELADWLKRAQPERPKLLDARAPAEYNVSHLPGAQLATTEAQALEILQAEPRDRLVVVYCSVGYRSSALAEQLQARGYTNVYNLEGSIFEWANKGRPVYQIRSSAGSSSPSLTGSASKAEPDPQGEQPVKLVHPYDAKWGVYLKRELWSALP